MVFAANRTGDAVPSHLLAAEQLPSNLVNCYSCFNNRWRVSLQNLEVLQQQKTLASTISLLNGQLPGRRECRVFFKL